MRAKKLIGHQGDVAFWLVERAPTNCSAVSSEAGRLIVARGEATGHHHSFTSGDVELYEAEPGIPFKLEMPDGTLADALFARVLRDTPLEHQEHNAVVVPKNNYWIVMPREYTLAAIVRSTD